MGKHHKHHHAFIYEGRFLEFLRKDGGTGQGDRPGANAKHLRLATRQGERTIKIPKALRVVLPALQPGDWIQVCGEATVDADRTKLKATRIQLAVPEPAPIPQPARSRPQTILFCQKSDCMKRGGKAVCGALAEALEERHLGDRVTLKGTGCMKQCKAGPNLVMPDKTRYTRIGAAEVPAIVEAHFPAPSPKPHLHPVPHGPDRTPLTLAS